MAGSQEKKGRVRKDRVHIEYDVHIGDAEVSKEIPFVVGVMADLAGDQERSKKLKERNFTEIDQESFDDVMGKIKPKLGYKVENTIAGDGSEISVDLEFSKMKDFEPDQIVQQVEPLRKLLNERNKLKDLDSRMNDRLTEQLDEIVKNSDVRGKVAPMLGGEEGEGDAGGEGGDAPSGEGEGS